MVGVGAALRELPRELAALTSMDGRREEEGVGERAREEAMEGRGDERADMVEMIATEERDGGWRSRDQERC